MAAAPCADNQVLSHWVPGYGQKQHCKDVDVQMPLPMNENMKDAYLEIIDGIWNSVQSRMSVVIAAIRTNECQSSEESYRVSQSLETHKSAFYPGRSMPVLARTDAKQKAVDCQYDILTVQV